tara:strand:+ start:429 stop:677 length:249 start_codon:yes stop_codon:yes gene_type:complete
MKILPKGDYVLFQAFSEDDKNVYGILERKEFMLEKMCDRDALYTHVAIGDDKEPLEHILRELNVLNIQLQRAEEVIYGNVGD